MTPDELIASLDAQLLARGEDIVLSRTVKRSGASVVTSVTCRAVVRSLKADQIAGSITANDMSLVISPTQIIAANWPGVDENIPAGNNVDQRLPKTTDKVIVQGRERKVLLSKPIFVEGAWVRTDLVVSG